MAHDCPWCGKALPVGGQLGEEGFCPACRGKVRLPSNAAGKIVGLNPPPGAPSRAPFELEGDSVEKLELADAPAEAPKRPVETAPGPAVEGPRPGDKDWRPYLGNEQKLRATGAQKASGIVITFVIILTLRLACMVRRVHGAEVEKVSSRGVADPDEVGTAPTFPPEVSRPALESDHKSALPGAASR